MLTEPELYLRAVHIQLVSHFDKGISLWVTNQQCMGFLCEKSISEFGSRARGERMIQTLGGFVIEQLNETRALARTLGSITDHLGDGGLAVIRVIRDRARGCLHNAAILHTIVRTMNKHISSGLLHNYCKNQARIDHRVLGDFKNGVPELALDWAGLFYG